MVTTELDPKDELRILEWLDAEVERREKGRGGFRPARPERWQAAYEERVRTGDTWASIAQHVGASDGNNCQTAAKTYALRNGLPWPPHLAAATPVPHVGQDDRWAADGDLPPAI